jgi:hypothetical protein
MHINAEKCSNPQTRRVQLNAVAWINSEGELGFAALRKNAIFVAFLVTKRTNYTSRNSIPLAGWHRRQ